MARIPSYINAIHLHIIRFSLAWVPSVGVPCTFCPQFTQPVNKSIHGKTTLMLGAQARFSLAWVPSIDVVTQRSKLTAVHSATSQVVKQPTSCETVARLHGEQLQQLGAHAGFSSKSKAFGVFDSLLGDCGVLPPKILYYAMSLIVSHCT